MRRITIAFLAVVVLCMLLNVYAGIEYRQVLVIEDVDNHKITVIPIPYGEFVHRFIHSVHKTPVYEVYRLDSKNNLVLNEIRFYSLGVGMPYTQEEGEFSNQGGVFRISGLNRKTSKIPLRISPIPEHTVIIEGSTYPLLKFGKKDGLIIITSSKKWMFVRK